MDTAVEPRSARSGTPFIVGVTGHRDLQPGELLQLRGAVAEFVRLIRARLPESELQFAIGMAEGADLLVAQTILELGERVNAVLPMPLRDYAADFDAENLALLQSLLKHPNVECDELELSSPAGGPGSDARAAMYLNLTQTLIRRTSVLLALWDGRPSPLPGGTADTLLRYLGVRTEREVNPEETLTFVDASEETESSASWVYWIPARRRADDEASTLKQPVFLSGVGENVLQMHSEPPAPFMHQLAELDDYNREYARLSARGDLARRDSLLDSLPVGLKLQDRTVLDHIDVEYGKADALAVHFQRRSDHLFKYFSISTIAMAVAFLSYERIHESLLLLYSYLLFMVSGMVLYFVLHRKRWFGRHLMYRVIAETLRAKFYLRLSGADDLVNAREVIVLSGIDRFERFGLVSCVVKSVEPLVARRPQPSPAEIAWIEKMWIQSQERYFVSKVARLQRNSARIGRLKKFVFAIILVVIIAIVAAEDLLHHTQVGLGITLKNLLIFCMGVVAVLFGVWEIYQNKMATRELLWQYRNQLTHFSRARLQLARSSSDNRRREIFAELGKDSLMESYLWTIHRYHREHEPPAST